MRKRSDARRSSSSEATGRRTRSRPAAEERKGDPWGLSDDPRDRPESSDADKATLTVGKAADDARRAARARVPDLDVGDVLEVTVGKETFSPVKYHTFDVGPVTVRGSVRDGEDALGAYMRLYESALVLFSTEFEAKCKAFFGRAVKAREAAEGARIRVE